VLASADDPDRLRGVHPAGVVLDEFASMTSREPLDVVRAALARSGGWLLVTGTPKGLNHYHDLVKSAETAGGWFISRKTLPDTRDHEGKPLIARTHVEQELLEGQSQAWIHQAFFIRFTR